MFEQFPEKRLGLYYYYKNHCATSQEERFDAETLSRALWKERFDDDDE